VNFSPAFKWLVAFLLCMTLVWKVRPTDDDFTSYSRRVVQFLEDHEFDVTLGEQNLDGMPIIRAARGSCKLVVAKSSSYGWNGDIIRDLRTGSDRLLFVFRGRVYEQQPMLRTIFSHLWSRSLVQVGLLPHEVPVLALVVSESCQLGDLTWSEVKDES
jgi:hypothetical protein